MNKDQQLLHRSIQLFQETLESMLRLSEELHTLSHDDLRQAIATLQGLDQDARQVDLLINKIPRNVSSHTEELFTKREEIINKLIRQNKLLSPRIRGMMAVISSEMSQIKGGKTAMTGYRTFCSLEKRGQYVCHSS